MRLGFVVLILLIGACSNLPENQTPVMIANEAPSQWRHPANQVIGNVDLLDLVDITGLDFWLKEALNDNPTLRRSLLEVAEAQWLSKQQSSNKSPTMDLSVNAQRTDEFASSKISNTFGFVVSTQWEIDTWGKLADARRANILEETAIEADFEYARRSLAANFLGTWLRWVNAKQQLRIEEERLDTLITNGDFVRERYLSGLGSISDLETSSSDSEQAKARVYQQKEVASSAQRQIQKILGSLNPVEGLPEKWRDIQFPSLDLPANSLGQRPDILAAYLRIQLADTKSAIAYKNLLPSFSLNLSVNQSQPKASDLLSSDPGWLLLSQIAQPLFRGGRLKAELKTSEIRAKQAYWAYREKMLIAVLEVENSLSEERSFAQQYVALEMAFQYAQASQVHIENRYRQGLATIMDLLDAQKNTYDIQIQLLSVTLNRAINRINLGLALGLPIKSGA